MEGVCIFMINKYERGVSLVVLVVTIIIMVILSGVSILIVVKGNLLDRAASVGLAATIKRRRI